MGVARNRPGGYRAPHPTMRWAVAGERAAGPWRESGRHRAVTSATGAVPPPSRSRRPASAVHVPSIARSGDAMKIDEYAPVTRPTSRAIEKSCRAIAPNMIEPTPA